MYDRYDADYLAVKDRMSSEFSAMSHESEIAIESTLADMENDPTAPGAAEAAYGKFQKAMKTIFEKIEVLVANLFQKLQNFVNRMILTDKGYKKVIREAEVNRKPLKAIKVIMYEYNPDAVFAIFQKYDKVMEEITNIGGSVLEVVKKKDNLLTLSPENLEAAIIERLDLPKEIQSFDQMMLYARKIFHGKKVEKTILLNELPEWMRRASKTDGVQQLVNNTVSPKKARTNQLKRVFLNTATQDEVPESSRNSLLRMASNVAKAYGKYGSLATAFFDMYLEFVVASRVVTKRFYQIS